MNNEHLAQKIIQIYQKYGRDWTELRGDYLYEKAWLDHFLALLPATDASVLDLGCGSGHPIAAYLIENGCQVTGIDRSEVMLEMARESFPEQTWIDADMRHFHFDQQFDGILAWDSFFHLTPDDQREMFAQFSAHAKLGAALMFTSGPSHGEAIGEMFGEPLYHASLDAEEYRALLAQYSFDVVKMVAEDAECTGHTVWLAKK
ncbi:class I SAM-dependent methyltransferase [Acinetobacter ursingii]|uniref:class I SAM-dependent methyltransferase n=1 Tax=Acinetobacter ursingii TaxID=108980 RepID=UPI0021CD41D9|nr:class I SAM-dependent methyltransferase [Acinetobacter ursingii]MCU4481649.1 class I SAM-dependent methyltransferase [Acinetobacter ursingii]MCU4506032.1 class I SAM-dependent methyltransferase [Acinetobacter ursingii]MCU4568768.1 class I SAM-dependent methyltransferase [Acinetobacter ursingii]